MRAADALISRRWLRLGVFLVALAYLPSLIGYGLNLWQSEHHRFFPLAVLAALALANRSLLEWVEPEPSAAPRLAGTLAALACVLFLASAVWWSPWLGYISFLFLVVALLAALGGASLVRNLFPALLMLAILIRLPLKWDTDLTLWLRGLAVTTGSWLLEVIGVPHLVSGAVIEIPGHRLLVAEACSGIISIFAVIAFGLFYGLWKRRPAGHIVMVMLAGAFMVLLGNVLRIGGGAYVQYHFGLEVLTGRIHEILGLVMLAAYVLLVLSADQLLLGIRRRYEPDAHPLGALTFWPYAEPEFEDLKRALADLIQTRSAGRGRLLVMLAGLFVGIGAAQCGVAWNSFGWFGAEKLRKPFKADAPFVLPDALADWRRVSGGPVSKTLKTWLGIEAVYSKCWSYRKGALVCTVALSYPYAGYHDLSVCYLNNGWQISGPQIQSAEGEGPKTIVELDLRKRPLAQGYLLYSAFTEDGQWRRLEANRARLRLAPEDREATCQVQLLITSSATISPSNKADARRLFLAARQILASQAAAPAEPAALPKAKSP